MVEANPDAGAAAAARTVEEIKQAQNTANVSDLDSNIRTENFGGYEHRQVSQSAYD